ncbi:MAG: hypothetical protein Kow0029_10160 [Candidatus Rifleibacteriota bacterium]
MLYVARQTSLIFTMACCVFTGIVGGFFVRQQGLITLSRIRETLENGAIPADEAIEALLLLIVGVLLCVPGFITDFMGFLIIIPGIRRIVASQLIKSFKKSLASGQFRVYTTCSKNHSEQKADSASDFIIRNEKNEIENATIVEVVEKDQNREG